MSVTDYSPLSKIGIHEFPPVEKQKDGKDMEKTVMPQSESVALCDG